jgi:hypothetical protein
MSSIKNKLNKSILASKVEIEMNNIENTNNIIKKILSEKNFTKYSDITVYHMESFYRDNSYDYNSFKNN